MAYPVFLSKLLVHTGVARWLPAVRRLTDDAGPFLRYYSNRMLSAPLRDLHAASALLESPGPDVVDLSQGSPTFDLVPSGSTKLPADRRGLPPPWGLPPLRQAVAERLCARYGVSPTGVGEVLITHGVTGAFSLVLDALVNPGDRVVLFGPTSPLYPLALRARRARVRWVPTWMENGRTRFHLEPMVRALGRARLVVLTSPANPTGGVMAPEDLEQIAWWAERRDVLIFEDQAFDRYGYDGVPNSIMSLPKAARRTLVAGGISKGYALASARVGWLAGHRHLVRPCMIASVLHTPFVPALCQQIALAALAQPAEVFEPIRAEFDSRRRYGYERLQAMGLKPDWPAGGFFFWVDVRPTGMTGSAFAERLLRARKVLVTPGELFGPAGAGHVRLSFAADDGRLREGLTRLADFLRDVRQPTARRAA